MKIGVSSLYYAKMLDEVAETYETPRALAGLSSIGSSASNTNLKFYADNTLFISNMYVGELEISIEIAELSAEEIADLLGMTADTEDVVTSKLSDVAPYVALGYKELDHNGAETFVWLLKGKFQVMDETITTKGKTPEAQPLSMVGNFIGKDNGVFRIKSDSSIPGYKDVSSTWFTQATIESV